MNRTPRQWLAALLLLVNVSAASHAVGIADHVPPTALGFIVVHDLNSVDAKLDKVMAVFAPIAGAKPPAPLALIKAATGLGAGLNESGDALLAALPGDASPFEPKPMLMLAASDFAAFASSVGGDPSGEIARVTIAGQQVLAAKLGDFILLMNVEHRPTMESLVGAAPTPPAGLAPLAEWLPTQDAALVVLPAGVAQLSSELRGAMSREEAQLNEQFSGTEMEFELTAAMQNVELTRKLLSLFDAEVASAAVGLKIDDDANAKLTKRVVLKPGGALAGLSAPKLDRPVLAGYPDKPFVFAGGGPFPRGWSESMAKVWRSLIEQQPEVYGFEGFDEAQWQKLEESWRQAAQIESQSVIMFVGDKEDALCSNIFSTMRTANSASYMDSVRKSMTIWNELVEASTAELKLKYEVADVDIDGRQALKMTNDVLAIAGDEDVPMVKPMFEKLLGNDGKLVMFLTPADGQTAVMSVSTAEQVATALRWATSSDAGLADSSAVKATTALLAPEAPWQLYISPQGCTAWMSRIYEMLVATLGGPALTVPEYPPGPPVGLSLDIADGQLQAEVVFPVQMLRDLSAYIAKVQSRP